MEEKKVVVVTDSSATVPEDLAKELEIRVVPILLTLDGYTARDGVDITHMNERRLARIRNAKIGLVFQSFHLIPTLTARENVEVPLYVGPQSRRAEALAAEMLDLVGLVRGVAGQRLAAEEHLDPCHQLSHGERLAQVVVGAELEAEHAVELLVLGGEEDDRQGL